MTQAMKQTKKKRCLLQGFLIFLLSLTVVWMFGVWLSDHADNIFRYHFSQVPPQLLIDMPQCKIPDFSPFEKEALTYFSRQNGPLKCPAPPSFLQRVNMNQIILNASILKKHYRRTPSQLNCTYQSITTNKKDTYKYGKKEKLIYKKTINDEFIKITCKLKKGKAILNEIIPLFHPKSKKNIENPSNALPERLNILILGIDSLSRLNFIRHLSETHNYLSQNLSAFFLKGYNKVGLNSYPNLITLFTGSPYTDFSKLTKFDDVDFVWKHYSRLNYSTLYAEDLTRFGTFNSYGREGFVQRPVDFYLRPAAIAMEDSYEAKKNSYCYRDKMQIHFFWDYLKSFLNIVKFPENFFSFTFVSGIVHDYLNNAGYMDNPTLGLLKYLNEQNILNNTLLFFFSDHGLRFGNFRTTLQGQYEDRLPMAFIYLPGWFLNKYPEVRKNLEINQNRLVTLFDVHATLIHFLNFTSLPPRDPRYRYGSSLFAEVPENRSCDDAGIPRHYCACDLINPEFASEAESQKCAEVVVDRINENLKKDFKLCYPLTLHKIHSARSFHISYSLLLIRILLETYPGHGIFEASLFHDLKTDELTIKGDISRVSQYGTTSQCVGGSPNRVYCFCRTNKIS